MHDFANLDVDTCPVLVYVMDMMITAETITDSQIRALRWEARNQGDDLQVAICTVALADIAAIDEDQRAALESVGIVPERDGAEREARDMCADVINEGADVINEAGAMDDSHRDRIEVHWEDRFRDD